MLRNFILILALVMTVVTTSPAQAQRRTLFDLLFGEEEAAPPPIEQPRQQPRQQPQQAPRQQPRNTPAPPVASLPAPVPDVTKNADATRLAVFGDSLAVDLARALERLYADDPNLVILEEGVGSSGFVRDDFFDWNAAVAEEISEDNFDLAVVIIGINDRQALRVDGSTADPLTDRWSAAYQARISAFLGQLRAAGKPVIWVGLPPMSQPTYGQAMSEISAIHRLASLSGGAEFVDIYQRFIAENGAYSDYGPDLSGQNVRMRRDDGIHFTQAGSDKLAFFIDQSIKKYYREGGLSIAVADPLAGTDAGAMLRPPFQGLGQVRLLEIAGAVTPLSRAPSRATELVSAAPASGPASPFSLDDLVRAPTGRADAFGVGIDPGAEAAPPGR